MYFRYWKFAWRHLLCNWRLEIRFISNPKIFREIIFEDVRAGCSLQPHHRTSSNSHSHFSIWTIRMTTFWRWSFIHFIKTRMPQMKLLPRKSLHCFHPWLEISWNSKNSMRFLYRANQCGFHVNQLILCSW